jgi:hypothetical protein
MIELPPGDITQASCGIIGNILGLLTTEPDVGGSGGVGHSGAVIDSKFVCV